MMRNVAEQKAKNLGGEMWFLGYESMTFGGEVESQINTIKAQPSTSHYISLCSFLECH